MKVYILYAPGFAAPVHDVYGSLENVSFDYPNAEWKEVPVLKQWKGTGDFVGYLIEEWQVK